MMKYQTLLFVMVLSFGVDPSFALASQQASKKSEFYAEPKMGSDAWIQRMKTNGDLLKQHNIRQLFLVHGTFVGDDPSGVFNFLSNIFSEHQSDKLSGIIQVLKQNQKKLTDKITRDEGNYTDNYANQLCGALGNNICNENDNIDWGSGDYHFARLDGALKLAQNIAEKITEKHIAKDETILLLGHSHAGQVFALLTTLLEDGEKAKQINDVIAASKRLPDDRKKRLKGDLDAIKSVRLDFVTFGTPIRYGWGNYKNFRLLPIINHRSNSTVSGIATVKDGDYVQQWGIEGTDLPSDAVADNRRLNGILDDGQNSGAFIGSLKDKERRLPKYWNGSFVHDNVLVDYRDNYQGLLPIPLPTYSIAKIFGHGVYTTENAMLFNIDLVLKNLYSCREKPQTDFVN